jgi:hypothetical protein
LPQAIFRPLVAQDSFPRRRAPQPQQQRSGCQVSLSFRATGLFFRPASVFLVARSPTRGVAKKTHTFIYRPFPSPPSFYLLSWEGCEQHTRLGDSRAEANTLDKVYLFQNLHLQPHRVPRAAQEINRRDHPLPSATLRKQNKHTTLNTCRCMQRHRVL